jgi:hypothetical protein
VGQIYRRRSDLNAERVVGSSHSQRSSVHLPRHPSCPRTVSTPGLPRARCLCRGTRRCVIQHAERHRSLIFLRAVLGVSDSQSAVRMSIGIISASTCLDAHLCPRLQSCDAQRPGCGACRRSAAAHGEDPALVVCSYDAADMPTRSDGEGDPPTARRSHSKRVVELESKIGERRKNDIRWLRRKDARH